MEKAKAQLELVLRYFSGFTPAQLEQLSKLQDLYTGWNEKINVISRKDIESLYEKHVLHSLAIAAAFDLPKGMQVVDIGTGGGFPGIPLAIFFPEVQFHLVDSIGKKIKVVEAVRDAIGLTNVTTAHTRAEDIRDRKFDLVVSRAVAPLKDLWTWGKPLLKRSKLKSAAPDTSEDGDDEGFDPLPVPNGLVCLKGGDLTEEIAASGVRPRIMEVAEIFDEEYFIEKYLLYVPL
jgi:16S rRNA (guanine527-N7)-methyltransferase